MLFIYSFISKEKDKQVPNLQVKHAIENLFLLFEVKVREHLGKKGTLTREYESTQDTLAREHVSTQETMARKQVNTQDALACEHLSTSELNCFGIEIQKIFIAFIG